MSIFKSLGGIAKQVTGKVSGFRSILDANPSAIGFLLPPQVQVGLTAASALNTALGGKLKIPSIESIAQGERAVNSILDGIGAIRKSISKGQLSEMLQGSFTKTFPNADSILGADSKDQSVEDAIKKIKSGVELLQSIDWLL